MTLLRRTGIAGAVDNSRFLPKLLLAPEKVPNINGTHEYGKVSGGLLVELYDVINGETWVSDGNDLGGWQYSAIEGTWYFSPTNNPRFIGPTRNWNGENTSYILWRTKFYGGIAFVFRPSNTNPRIESGANVLFNTVADNSATIQLQIGGDSLL